MGSRSTRRGVIAAIGGTAAFGFTSVLAGAQEGDGEGASRGADYWTVTAESAATTVEADTDEAVRSRGDLYVAPGVTVDAPVEVDGDVYVGAGTVVTGAIEADGGVLVDRIVDVDGGITATDDVLLGVDVERAREAAAAGDLESVTDLPMVGGLVVGDDVRSAGHVVAGPHSVFAGDVAAIEVSGYTSSGVRGGPPSVLLGSWTDVEGAVDAAGHVVLGPNTTVDGAVTAGRTALFGDDATFGSIDAARIDEGPAADLWPEQVDGSTGG